MGDQVKGRLALEHNVHSLKARISSKSSEISFKFSIQEKKILLQLKNNQKFGTEMSPDQFLKKSTAYFPVSHIMHITFRTVGQMEDDMK